VVLSDDTKVSNPTETFAECKAEFYFQEELLKNKQVGLQKQISRTAIVRNKVENKPSGPC